MERLSPRLQAAYKEHPWLHYHPDTITTYLPPDYYGKLLKPYTFNGKTDLELFVGYVQKHFRPQSEDVLEMGSGSGRATDALLSTGVGFHTLDLVDLSADMTAHSRQKYVSVPGIKVFESDLLTFLQASTKSYSAAFSLWGFSYSVHHHMNDMGIRAGTKYAEDVIAKFLTQNLRSGGSMFIVHPDILSDEQRTLKSLRQPTISKTKDKQSSSKRVLDATLEILEKCGLVQADCAHLQGDPIRYSSVDEALEVFLNFHMHGSLNRSRRLVRALDTLKGEFAKFQVGDEVFISPGCFIYTVVSKG